MLSQRTRSLAQACGTAIFAACRCLAKEKNPSLSQSGSRERNDDMHDLHSLAARAGEPVHSHVPSALLVPASSYVDARRV